MNTFYQENGYSIARNIFSTQTLDALEEDFDKIVNQITSGSEDSNARWSGPAMERMKATATKLVHTHNVQQFSARWHQALLHDAFLNQVEQLIGPDIVLHHSKLFMKPPAQGAPFPTHQDWSYFPTEKDTMMAAVIHVSEATDEMGCFRVYPGSHKLGRLEKSSGMDDGDTLLKYPIEGATVLEAQRGDVLFFHYLLLHGSMPNTSEKARKTVLVQMHSGDDAVEEGCSHPDEHLVLRGFNYKIGRSLAGAKK